MWEPEGRNIIHTGARRGGIKTRRVRYCPNCHRGELVFMGDIPAWVCLTCSFTQLLEDKATSSPTIGGLASSDDLTDRQTRPNTTGRSFHGMKDPRSKSQYAKKPNHPEIDDETHAMIDSHPDYHLVAYHEHAEQSSNVLSSSELRDRDSGR